MGVPMGDALSPAMTIGTCGWMEREWMNGLDVSTKGNFKAKRYMDDILLFFRKHGWDRERFYGDFKKSECYMPPLKLWVTGGSGGWHFPGDKLPDGG